MGAVSKNESPPNWKNSSKCLEGDGSPLSISFLVQTLISKDYFDFMLPEFEPHSVIPCGWT